MEEPRAVKVATAATPSSAGAAAAMTAVSASPVPAPLLAVTAETAETSLAMAEEVTPVTVDGRKPKPQAPRQRVVPAVSAAAEPDSSGPAATAATAAMPLAVRWLPVPAFQPDLAAYAASAAPAVSSAAGEAMASTVRPRPRPRPRGNCYNG